MNRNLSSFSWGTGIGTLGGLIGLGCAAGLFIGIFSSLLGVAGGELIIPTILLAWSDSPLVRLEAGAQGAIERRQAENPGVDRPMSQIVLESVLTCPRCGFTRRKTMPTDACMYFYECTHCGVLLRPKPGDCCVFCSFGSVKCPPIQANQECCGTGS